MQPRTRTPIRHWIFPAIICGEVVRALAADYPALVLRPVVGDFTCPLEIPDLPGRNAKISRRAGFFPGSTIGNFKPDAAMALLRRMRASLNGGGLLIGVDLVKDPARLHAAYNDAAGITALFNKNLMVRANRELGADFDPDAFAHYAPYNAGAHRIEMYLVSLKRQSVTIGGAALRLRGRRAGAYRRQPQIHHRKLPRDGGARRLQSPRGMDRRGTAVLGALAGVALRRQHAGSAPRQSFSTAVAVLPKNSSSPGRAATPITIMVTLRPASLRMASAGARARRNAGGHRHAIALAQLGHVLEHAFLAQPGARMPVGLGDEQRMHLRAGGARQRQRDLGGAARLGIAIDRHQDAAFAAQRLPAIGEDDQRAFKAGGKLRPARA